MVEITTAKGLEQSVTSVTVTGRTTYCDLLCVTTTSSEFLQSSVPRKKFSKSMNVSLPYRKSYCIEEISNKNVTPYQGLRNLKTKKDRNKLLKIERAEFMRKTRHDRVMKHNLETIGATKMQALFRGYCSRPKIFGNRRKPKGATILSIDELRSFLCELTSRLNLSHIQGLTLKMKTKSSRQRNRIDTAAAFRIQKFFRMLIERRRARRFMEGIRGQKKMKAMGVFRRIFRFFWLKLKTKKRIEKIKCACCIKIQSRIRIFLARRRVRLRRAAKLRNSRETEAVTIIQRSYRLSVSKVFYPDFAGAYSNLENNIFESELSHLISISAVQHRLAAIERATAEKNYLQNELARIAELKRLERLAKRRKLSLELSARQALEAERMLLEAGRLEELRLMRVEDIQGKWLMSEMSRLAELHRVDEEYRIKLEMQVAQDILDDLAALELKRLQEDVVRKEQLYLLDLAALDRQKSLDAEIERRVEDEMNLRREAERICEEERVESIQTALPITAELEAAAADEAAATEKNLRAAMARKSAAQVAQWAASSYLDESVRNILSYLTRIDFNNSSPVEAIDEDVDESKVVETEIAASSAEDGSLGGDFTDLRNGGETGTEGEGTVGAGVRRFGEDAVRDGVEVSSAVALGAVEDEVMGSRKDGKDGASVERNETPSSSLAFGTHSDQIETQIGVSMLVDALPSEVMSESTEFIKCGEYAMAESVLSVLLQQLLGLSPADLDESVLSATQLLLGHAKLRLAKYREASALFLSCERIRVRYFTEESVPVAEAKEGRALCAREQALYSEGRGLYDEALRATIQVLKLSSEESATEEVTQRAKQLHINLLIGRCALYLDVGEYVMAREGLAEVTTLFSEVQDDLGYGWKARTDFQYLQAVLLRVKGCYAESTRLMDTVLADRQLELGPSHPDHILPLTHLAEMHLLMCNYGDSSQTLESAASIGFKFYSVLHPIPLRISYLKSRILSAFGQYKNAAEICNECLRKTKSVFPSSHPAVADCLYVMGDISRLLGNPKNSLKFHEKCWEIRKFLFFAGEKYQKGAAVHICVCESLSALGMISIMRGTFFEAVPFFEKASILFEDCLHTLSVSSHIQFESFRLIMAHFYHLTGKFAEAEILFSSAQERIILCVGSEHLCVGDYYYFHALFQQTIGHYDFAIESLTKSAGVISGLLGPNHPSIARTIIAESTVKRKCGDFEASAGLLKDALALISNHFEDSCLCFGLAVHLKARLMRDTGDLSEASRLYSTAMKIVRDCIGSKNVYVAQIMGGMGECLRLEGQREKAGSVLEQALEFGGKYYGVGHYRVGLMHLSRALLCLDSGVPSDGLRIVTEEVIPIFGAFFPSSHPLLIYANGCVGKLLNEIVSQSLRNTNKSQKSSQEQKSEIDFDPKGRKLVKSALISLAEYSCGAFGTSHPWILELGDWGDVMGDSSSSTRHQPVPNLGLTNDGANPVGTAASDTDPSAEVADPDTDPSADIADLNTDTDPSADVADPDADTDPSADIAGPDTNTDTDPSADVADPDADTDPSADIDPDTNIDPDPSADIADPDTDPCAEVADFDIDIDSSADVADPDDDTDPSADIADPDSDPSADVADPDDDTDPSADIADRDTDPDPSAEVADPDIDIDPSADIAGPDTDPSADIADPDSDPSAEVADPDIDPDPSAEVADPDIDTDPSAEVADPDIDTDPSADIADPDIDIDPSAEVADPRPDPDPSADIADRDTDPDPSAEVADPRPDIDHSADIVDADTDPDPSADIADPDPDPSAEVADPDTDPDPSAEVADPRPDIDPSAEVADFDIDTDPSADIADPSPDPDPSADIADPDIDIDPSADIAGPDSDPRAEVADFDIDIDPSAEVADPRPDIDIDPSADIADPGPDPDPSAEVADPDIDIDPSAEVADPDTDPSADIADPDTDPDPSAEVADPDIDIDHSAEVADFDIDIDPSAEVADPDIDPSAEVADPDIDPDPSADIADPDTDPDPSAEVADPDIDIDPCAEVADFDIDTDPSADIADPDTYPDPSAEVADPRPDIDPCAEVADFDIDTDPSAEVADPRPDIDPRADMSPSAGVETDMIAVVDANSDVIDAHANEGVDECADPEVVDTDPNADSADAYESVEPEMGGDDADKGIDEGFDGDPVIDAGIDDNVDAAAFEGVDVDPDIGVDEGVEAEMSTRADDDSDEGVDEGADADPGVAGADAGMSAGADVEISDIEMIARADIEDGVVSDPDPDANESAGVDVEAEVW